MSASPLSARPPCPAVCPASSPATTRWCSGPGLLRPRIPHLRRQPCPLSTSCWVKILSTGQVHPPLLSQRPHPVCQDIPSVIPRKCIRDPATSAHLHHAPQSAPSTASLLVASALAPLWPVSQPSSQKDPLTIESRSCHSSGKSQSLDSASCALGSSSLSGLMSHILSGCAQNMPGTRRVSGGHSCLPAVCSPPSFLPPQHTAQPATSLKERFVFLCTALCPAHGT